MEKEKCIKIKIDVKFYKNLFCTGKLKITTFIKIIENICNITSLLLFLKQIIFFFS